MWLRQGSPDWAQKMADTSLWPVVVGGLLGVGGTLVGVIGTTIRDVAQQRHEKAKRRADKFEELVAAVYEFDLWVEGFRQREVLGRDVALTASPLAKMQSISAVYFPQFDESIREWDGATYAYRVWMQDTAFRRISDSGANLSDGFEEVYAPYRHKRGALLDALKAFVHDEFQ
jgi:hypothetical protein